MPRPKPGDPLLNALIAKLPAPETEWPVERQVAWLNLMAIAFGAIYGGDAASKIGARTAPGDMTAMVAQDKPAPFKKRDAPIFEYQNGFVVPSDVKFIIDHDGMVKEAKTGIVLDAADVNDTIYDLRPEPADLDTIQWADGSVGIGAHDLIVSRL